MHRLRHLLFWQAQFDSRRPFVWLTGMAAIVWAGPGTLGVSQFVYRQLRAPLTGTSYLAALTVFHAVLAALFVVVRGARTADERVTGAYALVQVADVPADNWALFRFLSLIIGFFPIWIIRLPLYVWCYHLGQVDLGDFLGAELITTIIFLQLSGAMMWISSWAISGQSAALWGTGLMIAAQAVFYLPRLAIGLMRFMSRPISGPLQTANEAALAFSQLSLIPSLQSPPSDWAEWSDAIPRLTVHFVLLIAALAAARWSIYRNVEPAAATPRRREVSRPPRRVWDDALAWQAFSVHASGPRAVAFRWILACLMSGAVLATTATEPRWTILVICAATMSSLVAAGGKMGDVVMREVRDQTLSTVYLLPLTPMQIYHGWKRGVNRLVAANYATVGFCVAIAFGYAGELLPVLLAMVIGFGLAPAFFFLNGVIRIDWRVFGLGAKVFPMMFAAIACGLWVGIGWRTPWGGLAAFTVLALATHRYIVSQIPLWFQRQAEKSS